MSKLDRGLFAKPIAMFLKSTNIARVLDSGIFFLTYINTESVMFSQDLARAFAGMFAVLDDHNTIHEDMRNSCWILMGESKVALS